VDQGSDEHWDAFLKDDPKFDIIIDDGSHMMDHQIVTLNRLFRHLNDGGIYVIEDVCTSYWPAYGGGFKKETSCIEYVKNLVDLINAQHVVSGTPPKEFADMFPNLKSATFYNNLIVIEKGPIAQRKTCLISDDFKNPVFDWN
jgi:hypothetical protein